MFDWPPPVGFSYCNGDPGGDGNSCGAWDDSRAADAEYAALRGWFDELFPEYKVATPNHSYLCEWFLPFHNHHTKFHLYHSMFTLLLFVV
jgi:hypothetical protein